MALLPYKLLSKRGLITFISTVLVYTFLYALIPNLIISSLFLLLILSIVVSVPFHLWLTYDQVKMLSFAIFIGFSTIEIGLRTFTTSYKSYTETKFGGQYRSTYGINSQSWYLRRESDVLWTSHTAEFKYDYLANSVGIQSINTDEVLNNRYKILCLGDSFTEGIGSPQDSSWPVLLESKLNLLWPDSFQVINAGIGGSDLFYQWKLYTDILKNYSPDEIIFCLNTSDATEIIIRGGEERFLPDSTISYKSSPFIEKIYKSSYIARYIIQEVMNYNYIFLRDKD